MDDIRGTNAQTDPLVENAWARIAALADLLERSAAAFERGERPSARAFFDAGRTARARVARAQQAEGFGPAAAAAAPPVVQALRRELARVTAADARLEPHLAPAAAGASSEESLQSAIDRAVPRTWDADSDLLVVVGAQGVAYLEPLKQRGFVRVLLVAPLDAIAGRRLPAGVLFASTIDAAERVCAMLERPLPERVAYMALPATSSDEIDVEALKERLTITVRRMYMDQATVGRFSAQWTSQAVRNVHKIAAAPSVAALDGEFSGKAWVVVCPGPSLAKNVHLLPALKGKAVLIAVSHALHAMLRVGVTPDLVVTVDSQEDICRHFEGLDLSGLSAVLLGVSVHESLFRIPSARRTMSLTANTGVESWMTELGLDIVAVRAGGTVAHAATALGVRWGAERIILVGQDLAYSGGRLYAEGSLDENGPFRIGPDGQGYAVEGTTLVPLTQVRGLNGEMLPTSQQFDMCRLWFEHFVRETPGVRFQNCTEGGAYIEGMDHLTLASVLEELVDPVDVEARFADIVDVLDGSARRAHVRATVEERLRHLEQTIRDAKQCVKMFRRGASPGVLKRAENTLRERVRTLPELSAYLQPRIYDVMHRSRDLRTVEAAHAMSLQLFEATAEACAALRSDYLAAQEEATETRDPSGMVGGPS